MIQKSLSSPQQNIIKSTSIGKGIPNAGFGAIKWYTWHGDQELIDEVNAWRKN